jgi:N-glycosylase/DNA lyase
MKPAMQSAVKKDQGIAGVAETVRGLKGDSNVRRMVEERMGDFRRVHGESSEKWYEELVYCLLTAYSSAMMGQRCVDSLKSGEKLEMGSIEDVKACLVGEGHRFANVRAEYIYNTRHLAHEIKPLIQGFRESREARAWLVKNIKGLGWKEASHFLRNVGYFDVAIIDRHIMRNMRDHGLIEDDGSKGLTKRRYLEYEEMLEKVSDSLGMSLGELDLYLWYRKTGKVLK